MLRVNYYRSDDPVVRLLKEEAQGFSTGHTPGICFFFSGMRAEDSN
jgi:hypothetical protein